MEPRQATTVDKAGWPRGPWNYEPDVIQWTHQPTGLPCLITRHHDRGHLCGYVAVPPGHPLHGSPAGDVHLATHWLLRRMP